MHTSSEHIFVSKLTLVSGFTAETRCRISCAVAHDRVSQTLVYSARRDADLIDSFITRNRLCLNPTGLRERSGFRFAIIFVYGLCIEPVF